MINGHVCQTAEEEEEEEVESENEQEDQDSIDDEDHEDEIDWTQFLNFEVLDQVQIPQAGQELNQKQKHKKFHVCSPDLLVTDEEWDKCQIHLDRFFVAHVLLYKPSSVYNYLHWFGSGHLVFYGKKYPNLAVMAQQVSIPKIEFESTYSPKIVF